MRSILAFIALLAFTAVVAAQAPKPLLPDTVKPPVISDRLRGDFFKAQFEMQAAAAQVQQTKQTAMQAVVKEVQDACGKNFQPQLTPDGDIGCIAALAK
jgi:opacity protein-like surface antigen